MISPYKFTFRGLSSLDFDVYSELSFDSDSGETNSFLNKEALSFESYNGSFRRVHSYKYSDVLAPTFSIIKKDYSDFTYEENRRILKWLTSEPNASFLDVYHDDSNVVSFCLLGNVTELNQYKNTNGSVIGYTFVFECVSPYAFSDLKIITRDVSNPSNSSIIINLETDEPLSAVYPRITINQDNVTSLVKISQALTDQDEWLDGVVYYYETDNKYYWVDADGVKHTSSTNTSGIETTGVVITNTYIDSDKTTHIFKSKIKNNIKGETVILDGANRAISSSRSNGRIFGNDFVNWSWIPLYEGKNELSFVGNCTVKIEYREPIKCGEL